MSAVQRFREEAVLFVGTLCTSTEPHPEVLSALVDSFGSILLESPTLSWNYSEYYHEEMGRPLFRKFLFFSPVIDTAILPNAKLKAVELEADFSIQGKRRVNLDPGYLSLAKVVLSSHKNYSHRIHLGRAVFAELELIYKEGKFHQMPYSYPDYRDKSVIDVFVKARKLLKKMIDALN